MSEIKIKVIDGLPRIGGRICSYETKMIRSEIQEFAEVNKEFFLPKKYTYLVTELNGFAKIITKEEQPEKIESLTKELEQAKETINLYRNMIDQQGAID